MCYSSVKGKAGVVLVTSHHLTLLSPTQSPSHGSILTLPRGSREPRKGGCCGTFQASPQLWALAQAVSSAWSASARFLLLSLQITDAPSSRKPSVLLQPPSTTTPGMSENALSALDCEPQEARARPVSVTTVSPAQDQSRASGTLRGMKN